MNSRLAVPALALVFGCLSIPAQKVPQRDSAVQVRSADERAILKADRDFAREAQTRKQDAWADFAEPNITLAAPDVKGREAFRAHWAKAYSDPSFKLTWAPDYARVFGDIGVTSGKYRSEAKGKRSTGRYVTVWQRQRDGTWKFAWDNGTSDKIATPK